MDTNVVKNFSSIGNSVSVQQQPRFLNRRLQILQALCYHHHLVDSPFTPHFWNNRGPVKESLDRFHFSCCTLWFTGRLYQ